VPDWAQVKAAGADLGICKVSESSWTDPNFVPNWRGMAAAAIAYRVGYDFAHPSTSAASAAAWAVTTFSAEGFTPNDRVALDMEVAESCTAAEVVAWSLEWAGATAILELAHKPLFYTYLAFLQWLGKAAAPLVEVFDLWIADYAATAPVSVAPWSTWVLWQFTSTGSNAGVHGLVDLDSVSTAFYKAKAQAPSGGLNAPLR